MKMIKYFKQRYEHINIKDCFFTAVKTIPRLAILTAIFIVGALAFVYFLLDADATILEMLKAAEEREIDVVEYVNITMALLTGLLLLITMISHADNYNLQRKIHKDNINITYLRKYLEIYNIYMNCRRLVQNIDDNIHILANEQCHRDFLKTDDDLSFFKYMKTIVGGISQHRETMKNIQNEVKLIFRNDKKMIVIFDNIYNSFFKISESIIQVNDDFIKLFDEQTAKENTSNELTREEKYERILIFITSPQFQTLTKISTEYNDLFSYDNFHKYFEPYIKSAHKG